MGQIFELYASEANIQLFGFETTLQRKTCNSGGSGA